MSSLVKVTVTFDRKLYLFSDTRSLITVLQPPVLTTALGHDVMMPCHLKLSHDERMVTLPVLYWYLTQNNTDSHRLFPSEKYERRALKNNLMKADRTVSVNVCVPECLLMCCIYLHLFQTPWSLTSPLTMTLCSGLCPTSHSQRPSL
uniref:Immunoglobulin V-set domain-containing protein n=1 Tax=Cyclopterus lumpus TaxID=8103 RepID=A0A8C2ZL20_CYCLU